MTTIHTNIRSILTNSGLSALKINSAYPARFSRQGAVYSLPLRYPARFSRQGGDTRILVCLPKNIITLTKLAPSEASTCFARV